MWRLLLLLCLERWTARGSCAEIARALRSRMPAECLPTHPPRCCCASHPPTFVCVCVQNGLWDPEEGQFDFFDSYQSQGPLDSQQDWVRARV